MKNRHLEELALRRPELAGTVPDIEKACDLIVSAYQNGKKVLTCGNGGSCSDADHIVGELMKGFLKKRPLSKELKLRLTELGGEELANKLQTPLRAINLCSLPALSTAVANDINPDYIFAQQAFGYTDPGDVFIGISTSGNASNVHFAAITAKAVGARLVGMTGADGGKMRESGLYNVLIRAPENVTHLIQESHIAIYHAMCIGLEKVFFTER